MNISLKKEHRDWIAEQVRSGRYESETAAINDALSEKIDRDLADRLWSRIEHSERQVVSGDYVVADETYFDTKRRMIRERFGKLEK